MLLLLLMMILMMWWRWRCSDISVLFLGQFGRRAWRYWQHVQFRRSVYYGSVQHPADRRQLPQRVHLLALLRIRVSNISQESGKQCKVSETASTHMRWPRVC